MVLPKPGNRGQFRHCVSNVPAGQQRQKEPRKHRTTEEAPYTTQGGMITTMFTSASCCLTRSRRCVRLAPTRVIFPKRESTTGPSRNYVAALAIASGRPRTRCVPRWLVIAMSTTPTALASLRYHMLHARIELAI